MPIDYKPFIHPLDAKALEALKKIPLLDSALKKFNEVVVERCYNHLWDASMVRLGPNQLPEIYKSLEDVSEKLGIETPRLYLTPGPCNAFTLGDTHPSIVLYSGLLLTCDKDEEIKATLAHECGHILCHHMLYSQLAQLILAGGGSLLGIPKVAILPLEYALLYWKRCSEFSADRVSAYCLRDPEIYSNQMRKFAAGFIPSRFQLNHEAFLEQARDYDEIVNESLLDKGIYYYLMSDREHPFPAKRALEVIEWYEREKNNLPPFANEIVCDQKEPSFQDVFKCDGDDRLKW